MYQMTIKLFEIRDRGTTIPALAVQLGARTVAEDYLLARAGYGLRPQEHAEYILLSRIDGGDGQIISDPFKWDTGSRTMQEAHRHILEHWEALTTGDVVDVEFILGETDVAKESERRPYD